jgi:hypothetical protein
MVGKGSIFDSDRDLAFANTSIMTGYACPIEEKVKLSL